MSFFLVFLAILAAGGVTMLALGRLSGDAQADDDAVRWRRGEVPAVRGLAEPTPNLPPVLLPDEPAAEDVDRLRFSLGLRGYRMDQVDEVLDRLRDQLDRQQRRIVELETAAELESAATPGSTMEPPATPRGSTEASDGGEIPAEELPAPRRTAPWTQ